MEEQTMGKWKFLGLALGLLAVSTAWGQEEPKPRVHSRPPYSGPKKGSKAGKAHPLPLHQGQKPGLGQKGKSDHILVR